MKVARTDNGVTYSLGTRSLTMSGTPGDYTVRVDGKLVGYLCDTRMCDLNNKQLAILNNEADCEAFATTLLA